MYLFPDTFLGILVHVLQISVALIVPYFFDHPAKDEFVTPRGIIAMKVFDFFNPVGAIFATGVGLYWWWKSPLRDLSVLKDSLGEWKVCFPGVVLVLLNFGLHGRLPMGGVWVFLLALLGALATYVEDRLRRRR